MVKKLVFFFSLFDKKYQNPLIGPFFSPGKTVNSLSNVLATGLNTYNPSSCLLFKPISCRLVVTFTDVIPVRDWLSKSSRVDFRSIL